MKRVQGYFTVVYLTLAIMFSCSLPLSHATVSEYTIYTRMTEIVLPPTIVYRETYPNWTFFEFEYSFEIINPSGKTLYILSPNTNLVFTFGNISFENDQYLGGVWGPNYLLPAGTNHTIDPGITEGREMFNMDVNDTLDALPSGNFTVWMYLDHYEDRHNYHNFTSEIKVNGTEIQITHNGANETFTFPEEPTPTLIHSSYFSASLLLGMLIFTLFRKRNRLHRSNKQ